MQMKFQNFIVFSPKMQIFRDITAELQKIGQKGLTF
jgi:hypothetical protein